MNWILGIIAVLIAIYLVNRYAKRKKNRKLKERLYNSWGMPKNNTDSNLYQISKYFYHTQKTEKAYHIINDKVKNDLDINQLFNCIDRTSSKIGQQYLYYKIRCIQNVEKLLNFNKLTTAFEKEGKEVCVKLQLILSQLSNTNSYYFEELIHRKEIKKPSYFWLIKSISLLGLLFLILGFFNPLFFITFIPVFCVNMFFHYKNKGNINYYIDGVRQINNTLNVAEQLAKNSVIKTHFTHFNFIKKAKVLRFKSQFISFDRMLNDEFSFIFWFFIEVIKITFNLEYIFFYNVAESIAKEKQSLNELFCFIGEVDVAISVTSLKVENSHISNPIFSEKKQMIIKEIHHPLIENCVPNNLTLSEKSLLLTGSNMSGKTTFIRTVALNSILAQTLYICFAERFEVPFLKIFSSVRITDDLQQNTSYFLEEVLTTKEFVEIAKNNEPCLFILDEIFKGTNTVERISGGKAILSHLNTKNHIVLVSTHDIELTDLLEQDNYELYHFNEQIINNELLFDHKLKKGKLKTRNAIKILELYGYPKEVINEAKRVEQLIEKR